MTILIAHIQIVSGYCVICTVYTPTCRFI